MELKLFRVPRLGGGSDELRGAKEASFALVVHQNQFDRDNGLVSDRQQERRASQADVQITSLAGLEALID